MQVISTGGNLVPLPTPGMSTQVFQTGDLGNLARLDAEGAAKLPTLMALKVRGLRSGGI